MTRGDLERVPRCQQSERTTLQLEKTNTAEVQIDSKQLESKLQARVNSRKWQEKYLSPDQRRKTHTERKAVFEASEAAHKAKESTG